MDLRSKKKQKRGAADEPKPMSPSTRIVEFSDGRILKVLHREMGNKLSMIFPRIVQACYGERIWNGAPGNQELELKGHASSVRSVAFSPDGKNIVSGSSDNTMRIWNATSEKQELNLQMLRSRKCHPSTIGGVFARCQAHREREL